MDYALAVFVILLIGFAFSLGEKMGAKRKLPSAADAGDFLPYFLKRGSAKSISIEDLLNAFIREHGIIFCSSHDEPSTVTAARTKLEIIRASGMDDHAMFQYAALQNYITALSYVVATYDDASPDLKKALRERDIAKAKTASHSPRTR